MEGIFRIKLPLTLLFKLISQLRLAHWWWADDGLECGKVATFTSFVASVMSLWRNPHGRCLPSTMAVAHRIEKSHHLYLFVLVAWLVHGRWQAQGLSITAAASASSFASPSHLHHKSLGRHAVAHPYLGHGGCLCSSVPRRAWKLLGWWVPSCSSRRHWGRYHHCYWLPYCHREEKVAPKSGGSSRGAAREELRHLMVVVQLDVSGLFSSTPWHLVVVDEGIHHRSEKEEMAYREPMLLKVLFYRILFAQWYLGETYFWGWHNPKFLMHRGTEVCLWEYWLLWCPSIVIS